MSHCAFVRDETHAIVTNVIKIRCSDSQICIRDVQALI